jgi:predicted SAM-dependent methyltransferase
MRLQALKVKIGTKCSDQIYSFRRKRQPNRNEIRINLGCGSDKLLGFINLDIDPSYKPDAVGDARSFQKFFKYDSVHEIRAIHILNYLTFNEALSFLRECHKLLRSDGYLVIEGPDIRKILLKYMSNDSMAIFSIFATNKDGPTHKIPYIHAWDAQALIENLSNIGFTKVALEIPQTHGNRADRDFRVVASK